MKDKKFGKSNKMQVQKLPTGIEGFDDVCRGGLPVSRSTLVSGTSGTGKTVFRFNTYTMEFVILMSLGSSLHLKSPLWTLLETLQASDGIYKN